MTDAVAPCRALAISEGRQPRPMASSCASTSAGANRPPRSARATGTRRNASFLNPAERPPDSVDVETLARMLGPVLFDFLLDAATFMNNAGRFRPGQRGLGERNGVSGATANRRIAKLVRLEVLTKFDPGGRETCRYQVTERFRPALLEARMRFRSDWWQEWRRPRAAAMCFISETEGEAGSKPPHFETTLSCNPPAQEKIVLNQSGDAESSADASPAGIKASESSPEATERPSDAGLTAARFEPIGTGKRKPRAPKAPGLAAQILARFDQVNAAFLDAAGDPDAIRRYWAAVLGPDAETAEAMRAEVRDRRRAARWKPRPGALPGFDPFNSRGRNPPPPSLEEKQRRRDLLQSKIIRHLKARGRPGAVSDFLMRMMTAPPAEAQIYFDAEVGRMRRSGWDDVPFEWYQTAGIKRPVAPPPKPVAAVPEATPETIAAAKAAAEAPLIRAGWYRGSEGGKPAEAPRIGLAEILAARAAR